MNVLTIGKSGEYFYNALIHNDFGLELRFANKLNQKDVEWAEVLALFASREPTDTINLSNIKWIHSFGAGVDGLLSRNDLHKQVIVSRTIGALGVKMGEFCLCHILNFLQHTYDVFKNQQIRKWQRLFPKPVQGTTALLLGTGEMAKGICHILKKMDIQLLGINTSGHHVDGFDRCITFQELPSVSSQVNFVINTLPNTKSTFKLLDQAFFQVFTNILFINVGRGHTLDIQGLQFALRNQHCSYAILDVFEKEPLASDSPLWAIENVFISPHQAAVSAPSDAIDRVASFISVLESIRMKNGHPLIIDVEKGY